MARAAGDEFERTTENAALVDVLRQRIAAEGAITFHDYMQTVLYHPQHGYYASRRPVGRDGDYLTSPEVHPIFGRLVAKQLGQMWETMGRPQPFDVVEQGAGSGAMARDILRWASTRAPEFGEALRYRIVEASAELRRQQEETLAGEAVAWLDGLPLGLEGCLLSNELIDSFPVHRVVHQNRQLLEIYVSFESGRFEELVGQQSTPRLAEYFADAGLWPGEGCVAEVNLHALDWVAEAARSLERGFVLTFDYGYEAEELYAPWRREGTLLGFYRHNASQDPFARIGKQDMTAHVDFTSVMRAGEAHGLSIAGFTTQARLLSNLGIGAGVEAAAKESSDDLEEYYARRRAVQELIDAAGLGRIRALAMSKGAGEVPLDGFAEDGDG